MWITQWQTRSHGPCTVIEARDREKIGARHCGYINIMENTNRIETLRSLLSQQPTDAFMRYGLAMEYVKSGELDQAVAEFRQVTVIDPTYAYAYFHGGQTLEKQGLFDEAREWYAKGIEASRLKGDPKALSELQAALDLLPL
jgi:tetratricopeptide (TPR) repeat protein